MGLLLMRWASLTALVDRHGLGEAVKLAFVAACALAGGLAALCLD
ncbi:hypothetical protein [uncultured Ramlibacter sp.]|nr:hypothetical protein [uncultured Ramlibacter sp.]